MKNPITTKNFIKKMLAMACMGGVVLVTNAPLVYACEVHATNVVANIVDDSVTISPTGDNFCDDGSLKVELKSALASAEIYYTIDGSDPVCGTTGVIYNGPFVLTSDKTVKAVSCHDKVQSLAKTKSFKVSHENCDRMSLKVNKVFYNVDAAHMAGTCGNENEWVEIYNPMDSAINLKGWQICDGQSCDTLSSGDLMIPAKGYAVVSESATTWKFWNIPNSAVKIVLGGQIGDGLNDGADMVEIKDASGKVIDQTNWGTPDRTWGNYNSAIWNPGYAAAAAGTIFGRVSNGYDTDNVSDWTVFTIPTVKLNYPNGGEKWYVGKTYDILWNASDNKDLLSVDLYYSKDSGKTWGVIARDIKNTGSYSWRLPVRIANAADGSDYLTASHHTRVKVVATDYTRNFMLSNWDISDADFCPPIDLAQLTPEEITYLQTIDTSGLEIVNTATDGTFVDNVMAGQGNTQSPEENNTQAPAKSSQIKNEDGKDYIITEEDKNNADKDSKGANGETPEIEVIETRSAESTIAAENSAVVAAVNHAEESQTSGDAITADEDAAVDFNLNA